ncbi:hypothetical protein F5Y19DRAFT_479762 [Xylariaceae sp. FL1651]|nr:hypothetical protein F5Y19DRAFT_479762 [Xylariaceae sp. FL1651]
MSDTITHFHAFIGPIWQYFAQIFIAHTRRGLFHRGWLRSKIPGSPSHLECCADCAALLEVINNETSTAKSVLEKYCAEAPKRLSSRNRIRASDLQLLLSHTLALILTRLNLDIKDRVIIHCSDGIGPVDTSSYQRSTRSATARTRTTAQRLKIIVQYQKPHAYPLFLRHPSQRRSEKYQRQQKTIAENFKTTSKVLLHSDEHWACLLGIDEDLKLDWYGVQPSNDIPEDMYYKHDNTHHYSRLVHESLIDGKGYAFSYDDFEAAASTQIRGTVKKRRDIPEYLQRWIQPGLKSGSLKEGNGIEAIVNGKNDIVIFKHHYGDSRTEVELLGPSEIAVTVLEDHKIILAAYHQA